MKFTRITMHLVLGGICLIFFGCASTQQLYSGPRLPAGEVATLEARYCKMISIDGQKVSSSKVEILPGQHSLEASYVRGARTVVIEGWLCILSVETLPPLDIEFYAVLGSQYVVLGIDSGSMATIQVQDVSSGKVIGSRSGELKNVVQRIGFVGR